MLASLFLKDFAIASEVEFDVGAGMTVISGETGAGKSLLVDALMLLTGSRADATSVRHGSDRAELSATFALGDASPAAQWLDQHDYAGDERGECQLRRVIRADGGSRAWINGRPATLGQLGELGQRLVEIHGQHEHQALLSRGEQLALLDGFGGHAAACAAVSDAHGRWQATLKQLAALPGGESAQQRIADCERQLAGLAGENLEPAALDALLAAHRRQANVAELLQGCSAVIERIGADDATGLSRGLGRGSADLLRLADHEPRLGALGELLASLQIQVDEVGAELERIRDDLDLDPARLDELDATLSRLHELGRRHRVPIERLLDVRRGLQDELAQLQGADQRREALANERDMHADAWRKAAAALRALRAASGKRLGARVSALMEELGMVGGRFDVELEPIRGDEPDPQGSERVEFLVSANAGQPPRALRKVASGGELSRISLAIEVAALGADAVPTMIFDEVDSGIGGGVAEVVGRTLQGLAAMRQVLCVTHLPQVAACGDAHFRVSKAVQGGSTATRIETLGSAARVEEIARMLGGIDITDTTRAHARQMLERSRMSE